MWFLRVRICWFSCRRNEKYIPLVSCCNNGSFFSSVADGDIAGKTALNDMRADGVVYEELEERNKSRLPKKVYHMFIKKEPPVLITKYQFTMKSLRKHYGKYGKLSGINPGIAWPTRAKLMEIIEDNNALFDPPLEKKIKNIRSRKEEKLREKLEYEAEVDENMKKLDGYIKLYHDNIAKKEATIQALQQKRALLKEEISEFLGYDVDPKDPKFQEAVEMKEKEKKKALKLKKQEEAYEKMIAKLLKIAGGTKDDGADNTENIDDKPRS